MLVIGVIIFTLIGYSSIFGTPYWLLNVFGPTTEYAVRGLSTINRGLSYFNWNWIYLGIALASISAVTFA